MTDNEQNTEKQEANRLTNNGIEFAVTYKRPIKKENAIVAKIKGLFGKVEEKTELVKESFTISEPTLAVLDLLSAQFIGLDIDLNELTKGGNDTLSAAKRLAKKHARNAAKIAAIATLGEDCFTETNNGYKVNSKLIESRTDFFFHSVKPSELNGLCDVITGVCNLGNFTNSMVLMSASRTTAKKAIE